MAERQDTGRDCIAPRSTDGAVTTADLEAWFVREVLPLKTERTARKTYRTRDEAKADVFDYIERFSNTKRRHSTIGYMSPMEFEMRAGLA